MALLAETIKKLLTKAGFDTSSESYLKLIQAKELMLEVPDDVDTSLSGLMSFVEAKNNIEIKKHFKAEALDPFNKKAIEWLKEHGADEATIKAVADDVNTYNKVETAIKKIAELKSAAAGGGKGEKAELEKKINELSATLSKATADAEKAKADAIAEVTQRYENEFTELEINRIISGKQLPGQFGLDVETKIAREFLNKKLEEKKAIVKKVDGKLKLFAKDDEKMLIFDNGKELDLDTLTDMALADNKFLKVSDPGGGNPPRPTPGTPPKLNSAATSAISQIDEALSGN